MSNNWGLNNDYEYTELSLDSLDASYSNSGLAAPTDWPLFFVAGKGPIEKVVAFKVIEVQIPISWYTFNNVNNTFLLTETGFAAVTVTLPIGNYNALEMTTILASALSTASPNFLTYTVTYSQNTGKFTIFNNAATSVPFTLTFGAGYGIPGVQPNSGNKNPRLWIGFPPGITSSSPYGTGDYMISPNYQNVGGPAYIYLNSQIIGSTFDLYLPEGAFNLGGGKAGPQCAKIPVTANSDGWIQWQDPDAQKYFVCQEGAPLHAIDFYLTLGNTTSQVPLQLNGLNFSLKLAILTKKINSQGDGEVAFNGRVFNRQEFNSNR